ncbi:permease [Bordetella pertussis]|uniref:Membrane protein n=3 Tax=Bordetella pertussis TaxID=520 RepID=Q7VYZ5_BORPE|nr:FTR1 family protein [Bordetella pertussis]ETH39931.1 iron permease FTR1 family protein [Bordetella pertussis H918]ETH41437.1 iron permease FTR1 family protein [Bordetella pertussis H939]ETH47947.1 iron permease FTR1 family protein [Bordetella pertussis H921]ETH69392.1 iron permease FTR1 family protein [Bordetella pertussis STO1-CHLA-0011]ETH84305.1 iron permease FTR1 family protein [Bordetella pertussis STO1-CHOC-0017]ETH88528.1 iron permease FTR1 family protein [Bordetella pertussis STO1-
MEQVLFIVWRESVEALLVVGILYAWLRATPAGRRGMPYLWGGVAAGLALALLLALVLLGVSSWLSDEGQEWFQAGMSLVACALVVQMVIWMKRHGRTLKRELEGGARASIERDNWWGLLVLVMIAVAREGSETVVFLYGTVAAAAGQAGDAALLVLAGAAGFLIALLTFWLLQLGGKLITWRRFFRVTEILLLLLAGALLVGGLDHLISLDVLPTLIDPVWDSSWLLDDSSGMGKVLADFAGYRAYPALISVLLWLAYWLVVWLLLRRADGAAAISARSAA